MKKITAIIIAFIMLIICCGCEKQDTTEQNETQPVIANEPEIIEPEEKEPEPIKLTSENMGEYLKIKYSYEKNGSDLKMTIDIEPLKAGKFENTKLILVKYTGDFDRKAMLHWELSPTDPSYKYCEAMYKAQNDWCSEYESTLYCFTEIKLPSNGYYTETHSFWEWYGNLPEPDDSYETFHVSPGSKYDEDLGEVVAYGQVSDLLPEGTPYFSGTFIPAE